MGKPATVLAAIVALALPVVTAGPAVAGHVPASMEVVIGTDDLTGRWLKESTDACAERYPAELVLRPGGLYEAPGGPEAGSLWHSGEWRLEDGSSFVIQMANDEMRAYRLEPPSGDALSIRDAEGCRIVYRRAG